MRSGYCSESFSNWRSASVSKSIAFALALAPLFDPALAPSPEDPPPPPRLFSSPVPFSALGKLHMSFVNPFAFAATVSSEYSAPSSERSSAPSAVLSVLGTMGAKYVVLLLSFSSSLSPDSAELICVVSSPERSEPASSGVFGPFIMLCMGGSEISPQASSARPSASSASPAAASPSPACP